MTPALAFFYTFMHFVTRICFLSMFIVDRRQGECHLFWLPKILGIIKIKMTTRLKKPMGFLQLPRTLLHSSCQTKKKKKKERYCMVEFLFYWQLESEFLDVLDWRCISFLSIGCTSFRFFYNL